MKQVLSEEARRRLSDLLDEVEHDGVIVEISRYKTPAAVMVPPEWFERATEALSLGEPDGYGKLCALFEAAWHHDVPESLEDLAPMTSTEARKLAMLVIKPFL